MASRIRRETGIGGTVAVEAAPRNVPDGNGAATRAVLATITPLREVRIPCRIVGTAPFMQNRFSEKAMRKMIETQKGGKTSKSRTVREPRDFDADCKAALHLMKDKDGKEVPGIPAGAIRSAMISACRMVGFKMTIAKGAIFVVQDGLDIVDGCPLVKIIGHWEKTVLPVRNQSGVCDLRSRPMWREWHADITIRYDADQFTHTDVINLLYRAGQQVGIGEGRPDSKESHGLGYGLFRVETREEA